MNKTIDKTNIEFLPVRNVSSLALANFYSSVFPHRKEKLKFMCEWVNNFFQNGSQTPLVAVYGKRVIAHAGVVPFNIFLNGKEYTASWFVDFAVLKEFRNQGIGSLLTDKLMQVSDLSMALAAEKSGNIFKRCGWSESADTYLLLYPLNPFYHHRLKQFRPYFLQRTLNSFFRGFIKRKYNKSFNKHIEFFPLTLERIKEFSEGFKRNDDEMGPLRNHDYLVWRLLGSFESDKYRFLEIGGIKAIIKLGSKDKGSYLDILCLSNTLSKSDVVDLVTSLGIWGLNNGFSFMRQYTSSQEVFDCLLKQFKPSLRKPPFLFYAKNKMLMDKIKEYKWRFEFIDSDFELM